MPLTAKGKEILANYVKEFGAEKGERYFYASKNAGTITGVDSDDATGLDSQKLDNLILKADLLRERVENLTRDDA